MSAVQKGGAQAPLAPRQQGRPPGYRLSPDTRARMVAARAGYAAKAPRFVQDRWAVIAVLAELGKSDSAIARRLGFNRTAIFRWRVDLRIPEHRLPAIAETLGWSLIGLRWRLGWWP